MESAGGVVPIHFDEETDLHYIKGIRYVLFENGVKINRTDFDNRFASKQALTSLIKEAEKKPENCGWDYDTAISTQNLQRVKGTKKMDIAVPISLPEPTVKTEEKTQDLKETIREKVSAVKSFFSAPYTDVIVMMLVVGILCVSMSIYHTNQFLLDSGKHPIVAITAAVAMVIFSASAYTAARNISQDKGIGILSRLLFSSFLVVCGTFVILYSVFSTVNVSYDQYKLRESVKVAAVVKQDVSVDTSNTKLTMKDQAIKTVEDEITGYLNDSNLFYLARSKDLPNEKPSDDPAAQTAINRRMQIAVNERSIASRDYDRTQKLLTAARQRRQQLIDDRMSILDTKSAAITKAESGVLDAYDMVASKLGIAEETLRFIIYAIPATFFDIVAPFALAIVLLLKDRRNGKEASVKKSTLLPFIMRFIKGEKNAASTR
jgi:succinate dehydrogenase hydrophobic anchor subunit